MDFPPTTLEDLLNQLQNNVHDIKQEELDEDQLTDEFNVEEYLNDEIKVEDLLKNELKAEYHFEKTVMPTLEQEASTSSSDLQSPLPSNGNQKRRAFDVEFKLQAVRFAKAHSKNAAGRRFGVCRALIQRWVMQENELLSMQSTNAKRLKGGGRHRSFPKLDNELADWVKGEMRKGKYVSRRMIQMKAEHMFQQGGYKDATFQASSGWLEKFLERHNIKTAYAQPAAPKPQFSASNLANENPTEKLLKLSQKSLPKKEPDEMEFDGDDDMPQLDLDMGPNEVWKYTDLEKYTEKESIQFLIDRGIIQDWVCDNTQPAQNESMTQDELNLLSTNPTEFCNYILQKFGDTEKVDT
ncbi:unnamed protein product, partial [Mesorhabditis belari]|uniref:HTH CENPB-type domain-containing protein n=1 Tax=Mesorhabditis belari TaxID=2138241 RepID=A0AAF3J369_9BILA